MKKVTQEQIDKAVNEATVNASQNLCELLVENIDSYQKSMNTNNINDMQKYNLYFACINTALEMSVDIMKESLYKLLCDE